jgi:hypothetical protein
MIGAGRALPHKGLSALQACKTIKASRSALRGRRRALILIRWDHRFGVGSLTFIVADYAAIRAKKNGQFRTANSDGWREDAVSLVSPSRGFEHQGLVTTLRPKSTAAGLDSSEPYSSEVHFRAEYLRIGIQHLP